MLESVELLHSPHCDRNRAQRSVLPGRCCLGWADVRACRVGCTCILAGPAQRTPQLVADVPLGAVACQLALAAAAVPTCCWYSAALCCGRPQRSAGLLLATESASGCWPAAGRPAASRADMAASTRDSCCSRLASSGTQMLWAPAAPAAAAALLSAAGRGSATVLERRRWLPAAACNISTEAELPLRGSSSAASASAMGSSACGRAAGDCGLPCCSSRMVPEGSCCRASWPALHESKRPAGPSSLAAVSKTCRPAH